MATKSPKDNTHILEFIYQIVQMIPKGRVTSYGAIAQAIGLKSGARFVGWAMNQSHFMGNIPAHRVVNSQGLLTGKHKFATPTLMEELLQQEGIKVINNKIANFKSIFWNPIEHIQL